MVWPGSCMQVCLTPAAGALEGQLTLSALQGQRTPSADMREQFEGHGHVISRVRKTWGLRKHMHSQDMRAKLGQQLATGQREGLRPGMQPPDVDPERFAGLSFKQACRVPLSCAPLAIACWADMQDMQGSFVRHGVPLVYPRRQVLPFHLTSGQAPNELLVPCKHAGELCRPGCVKLRHALCSHRSAAARGWAFHDMARMRRQTLFCCLAPTKPLLLSSRTTLKQTSG